MKVSGSVTINAPIDKVFSLFSNLDGIKDRISGIKSIELLEGPAQMAVGTKWTETRVMMGKEASETMTVSSLEKNRHYVTDAASHGMEYKSKYSFEEVENGTKVTMDFVGIPVSVTAKLLTPIGLLFRGVTKKALLADMNELKKYAEEIKP